MVVVVLVVVVVVVSVELVVVVVAMVAIFANWVSRIVARLRRARGPTSLGSGCLLAGSRLLCAARTAGPCATSDAARAMTQARVGKWTLSRPILVGRPIWKCWMSVVVSPGPRSTIFLAGSDALRGSRFKTSRGKNTSRMC